MEDQDHTGSSEECTSSELDFTTHEYARECGLCTDYLTENPWDILQSWEPYQPPTEDLEDPEGAEQNEVTADGLSTERLDIDPEARELLYWTMKDEESLFLHTLPRFKRLTLDLKSELPLLKTDHELDVLHFGHRCSPDFTNMNLPMEHTELEKDESMEWPTKHQDLPQRMEMKYGAQKLDFPREGVEFLMGVIKDSWIREDVEDMYNNEFTYTKVWSQLRTDQGSEYVKANRPFGTRVTRLSL